MENMDTLDYGGPKFEKIHFDVFKRDVNTHIPSMTEEEIIKAYDNLELPKRATSGSAGHDFYVPYDLTLNPHEQVIIPTCIRSKFMYGSVLLIVPRSSLGIKHGLRLSNTVGVIDSDYYHTRDGGHILLSVIIDNTSNSKLDIKAGSAIAQGIFVNYEVTNDTPVADIREGGIGSTGNV